MWKDNEIFFESLNPQRFKKEAIAVCRKCGCNQSSGRRCGCNVTDPLLWKDNEIFSESLNPQRFRKEAIS